MITLISILGNYWAKHYFHLSENEILKYGLIGVFFARIFGTNWFES